MKQVSLLLASVTCLALGCLVIGPGDIPAYATDQNEPPAPAPKNDDKDPKAGDDGGKQGVLDEADKGVADPFNRDGPKISNSMLDLYREHQAESDNDFNRTHEDVHRKEKPAEDTDGYRDIEYRRERIETKLSSMDGEYEERLKLAAQDIEKLEDALKAIEETMTVQKANNNGRPLRRSSKIKRAS